MQVNKIYTGDCLEWLRQMPDNLIDCCVTSPPYYGLRDYGTAQWSGGDSGCDHKGIPLASNKSTLAGYTSEDVKVRTFTVPFKDTCLKCGATRIDNQIGLEETPIAYVSKLVEVFREVKRVLKKTGVLWLNLGDSYAGSGKGTWSRTDVQKEVYVPIPGGPQTKCKTPNLKPKDLIGIPWMVAFALRADGWYLRQDIIWAKPNPMPESVTDRCTKSHEYIFLLSKSQKYYYDAEAIKYEMLATSKERRSGWNGNEYIGYINGAQNHLSKYLGSDKAKEQSFANKRSVWTVTTKPFSEAHFATFPEDLISDCIKAGCQENGIVLDPFMGAGTTALVARKLNRNYIGIELNEKYVSMANKRLYNEIGLFL